MELFEFTYICSWHLRGFSDSLFRVQWLQAKHLLRVSLKCSHDCVVKQCLRALLKVFTVGCLNVSKMKLLDNREQCFENHFNSTFEPTLNPWLKISSYHARNISNSNFFSLHSICECVRISQWQIFCGRRFKNFFGTQWLNMELFC